MKELWRKIWAKMPWSPKFYAYITNGERTKGCPSLAKVFCKTPLPRKERGRCSVSFTIKEEEDIVVGGRYDIAFCDPRFAGSCQLLAKGLVEAEKLEIFNKIPSEAIDFIKMCNFSNWWLWLRLDGSWVLANAFHTALAERVRLEE